MEGVLRAVAMLMEVTKNAVRWIRELCHVLPLATAWVMRWSKEQVEKMEEQGCGEGYGNCGCQNCQGWYCNTWLMMPSRLGSMSRCGVAEYLMVDQSRTHCQMETTDRPLSLCL